MQQPPAAHAFRRPERGIKVQGATCRHMLVFEAGSGVAAVCGASLRNARLLCCPSSSPPRKCARWLLLLPAGPLVSTMPHARPLHFPHFGQPEALLSNKPRPTRCITCGIGCSYLTYYIYVEWAVDAPLLRRKMTDDGAKSTFSDLSRPRLATTPHAPRDRPGTPLPTMVQ